MCKRSIYNTQCFDGMNTIRLLSFLFVFCIEKASIIICLAYGDVLLVWERWMGGYKTVVGPLAWRWCTLPWKNMMEDGQTNWYYAMCGKMWGLQYVKKRWLLQFPRFYRSMHFSAKRGIAIACRLSVRLSVCPSVRPSVRLWRWWIVIT